MHCRSKNSSNINLLYPTRVGRRGGGKFTTIKREPTLYPLLRFYNHLISVFSMCFTPPKKKQRSHPYSTRDVIPTSTSAPPVIKRWLRWDRRDGVAGNQNRRWDTCNDVNIHTTIHDRYFSTRKDGAGTHAVFLRKCYSCSSYSYFFYSCYSCYSCYRC